MATPRFSPPERGGADIESVNPAVHDSFEEGHITSFNQLRKGDFIDIQHGPKGLKNNKCKVHAIDDIKENGQTAELTFSEEGNTKNKTTLQLRLQRLYVFLKKVRYNERKFSPADTVERARRLENIFKPVKGANAHVAANVDDGNNETQANEHKKKITYNLCRQNCEHFASACVNGPDELKEKAIKDSLSVQASDGLWILISLVFWVFQAIFFGFNFWMYAVFVRKDCDFEFLTNDLKLLKWLCKSCYQGNDSCLEFIPLYTAKNCTKFMPKSFEVAPFDTICDWILIAMFVLFFLILSTIITLVYRKDKHMCKRCYDILCIHQFFSRNVSLILIEAINILSEDLLYSAVSRWNLDRWSTVIMLIIVSTLGALCVYSLASVLTKLIVLCCSTDRVGFWKCIGCWKCSPNCCKSSCCETYSGISSPCSSCCSSWRGYAKYVPFRGIIQCCCRNAHSKYLQPRIDEEAVRQKRDRATEKACMVCRIEIPIFNFNQIEPGDHISMPGAAQFANFLYKHHAIVTKLENVSRDGTEANVEVIDVPRTGKGCCSSTQIPVQRHSLFDADRHRLTSSRWVHGFRAGVRIIKQKPEQRRGETKGGQSSEESSVERSSEARGRSGVKVESVDLQDFSQSQIASQ